MGHVYSRTESGHPSDKSKNLLTRAKESLQDMSMVQKCGALVGLTAVVGSAAYGAALLNGSSSPQLPGFSSASAGLTVSKNENTFGYTNAAFEKIGNELDNPQRIFSRAGYTPLWTASKAEASSSLPKGLSVVPKEARVWEPWFRKHLTQKGNQLSTADMLKIKWTVIQTVANDPACQFKAGQADTEIFKNVEAARVKALKSLGLDDSNPVIFQISRADAAFARTKSQRGYTKYSQSDPALMQIEDGLRRYPTLSELNKQDYGLNCGRSGLEMIYILRGMEKIKPSGLQIGALFVFRFDNNGRIGAHGIIGGQLAMPDAGKAYIYYDPTAAKDSFYKSDLGLISRYAGPLDRASFERLANTHCIARLEEQSNDWEKDGVDAVYYNYILGENWPQFTINNYDYQSTLGGIGGILSMKKGRVSFGGYHHNNLPKIVSLGKSVDAVFSGQFQSIE